MLLIGSVKDVVFVDTMNLDGETNLKEKLLITKFTVVTVLKKMRTLQLELGGE